MAQGSTYGVAHENGVLLHSSVELKGVFSSRVENFLSVTSDVLWDVGTGVRILIKKLIT
jgi:hypothetical protein